MSHIIDLSTKGDLERFFRIYPTATLYNVGDKYYFRSQIKAANIEAKRLGTKVKEVEKKDLTTKISKDATK